MHLHNNEQLHIGYTYRPVNQVSIKRLGDNTTMAFKHTARYPYLKSDLKMETNLTAIQLMRMSNAYCRLSTSAVSSP